jgi:hypothetical protein
MIRSAIEMGNEHGMQTMEQSLKKLYEEGKIALEEALIHAFDLESMNQLLGINGKAHAGKEDKENLPGPGMDQNRPGQMSSASSSPFRRMPMKTDAGAPDAQKRNKSVTSGGYVIDDGQAHYARDPLYSDGGSYYNTDAGSRKIENNDDDEF